MSEHSPVGPQENSPFPGTPPTQPGRKTFEPPQVQEVGRLEDLTRQFGGTL